MPEELPYQLAPQVRQLLAERENAEAYGQASRLEAVDKQLAELGYKRPAQAAKAAASAEAAAEERAEASEQEQAAPPKGRTSRAGRQQTTTSDKPRGQG